MQASPPAGPVLADSDPGNSRVLFVILFWFALATSVELWWLDTPARSVTSTGEVLLAAGRISGMVAGFVLLAQVLLMSRVGWLERGMGSYALTVWHRELGGYLVVAALAHVILISPGYAGLSLLLAPTPGVIKALVATAGPGGFRIADPPGSKGRRFEGSV